MIPQNLLLRLLICVIPFLSLKVSGQETASRINEDLACQCLSFASKGLRVCGTDLQNYTNTCELAKAMVDSKTLGLLCNHACPCPEASNLTSTCHTRTNRLQNLLHKRTSLHKPKLQRMVEDPSRTRRYCLTDGTEATRDTVWCSLQTKKEQKIGLRCTGSCKDCDSLNESCPVKLLEQIPLFDNTPGRISRRAASKPEVKK